MRKSTFFFLLACLQTVLLMAAWSHAAYLSARSPELLKSTAELVERLELTDICLFTEARYTRHLTQADLHSPFQDHPMSLEHFPSGSLLRPRLEAGRQ